MTFWDGTRWVREAGGAPPSPDRKGRRLLGAFAEASLITMLVSGLIAGTALAGKGGHASTSNGSSLTLVLLDSTDGVPHYGQQITFDVSTTATDTPYVNVRCYQGAAFVFDSWVGFYDGAWFGQTFTLASQYWLGGAADCEARLVAWGRNGREKTLTAMTFHVEP